MTAPSSIPTFAFRGDAKIGHLNVRKEGPEDDKELAVDVKLSGIVDAPICDYFDLGLRAFLWDDVGIMRNPKLAPVAFSHEIKNCDVQIEGLDFRGCTLHKFKLSPRDGFKVDFEFSVALKPNKAEIATLAEHVLDAVTVHARPQPGLFDGVKAAAENLDAKCRADGTTMTVSDSSGNVLATFGGEDELLPQARELVLKNKRASISLVQRHLRIGYNRAARLLEELEKHDVVSAMGADGIRTVQAH